MSRLALIDPKSASGPTKDLLDAVHAQFGAVPNFIRLLANSPAALSAFLELYGPLDSATIDKATRERIALVVAEDNACQYCVSAHTAIGRSAGLSNEEMLRKPPGRLEQRQVRCRGGLRQGA